MTDILDQLLNARNANPDWRIDNPKLMDRAAEEIMRLRSLTFEMLSALSWLRSKGLFDDPVEFEKMEREAREALHIADQTQGRALLVGDGEIGYALPITKEIVEVIKVEPPKNDALLPTYKICPHCGDRNAKTVHLRRRPPQLQCNACGVAYKWPHRWM